MEVLWLFYLISLLVTQSFCDSVTSVEQACHIPMQTGHQMLEVLDVTALLSASSILCETDGGGGNYAGSVLGKNIQWIPCNNSTSIFYCGFMDEEWHARTRNLV